jgi:AcrR family transcriptional regulator
MQRRIQTNPRKTPKQRRSGETVEIILEATARILVSDGYDHASTNKIALAAGVSIGSLYQYFPNKEALVATLCERHISEMLAICEGKLAEVATAPLPVAAREIVCALLRAHAVEPKLHKVLIEQVPRVGRLCAINDVGDRMTQVVHAYLASRAREIRPQNLEVAAFVLVRAVEAVAHATVMERPHYLPRRGKTEDVDGELADELSELVLRYVRA